MQKFIAYTRYRRKMVESAAHTTREEAARELFTKYPGLKECVTCGTYMEFNGKHRPNGSNIQTMQKRHLPAPKMTKAEALAMLHKLYQAFNTADHETKAEWMTHDLAGENGCALFDKVLRSKAFTDEDRDQFMCDL